MNKSTKIIIGIILVLILVVAILYVVNIRQSENAIRIGVTVPLTGDFAVLGTRIKNGIELAKSEIEKDRNIKIETFYEDVCYPKDMIPAVNKLIEVDKINIIGGNFCLIGFIPTIPIFQQNRIIAFNTAKNPDLALNHDYVFSPDKAIKDDAKDIADFAFNNLKAKTAAVIYYNTQFGTDYGKYFDMEFKNIGGKILSDQMYELNQTDFRAELTKIKSNNPDVIFTVGLAGSLGDMLKQIKEFNINAKILSESAADDPSMLSVAGTAAEGLIISSQEPAVETDKMKIFRQNYKNKYGEDPDVFAADAYDSTYLQIDAYQKCNGNPDCMNKELHNVKNYQGVSGEITIQPDGSSKKPHVFKIVENGQFIPY